MIEVNVDEGDVEAQRFYEPHGFSASEPESTDRAFYYRQLVGTRVGFGADGEFRSPFPSPSAHRR